jgi:hypothetical protein
MKCEMCTEKGKEGRLGKAVAVKFAEVQHMARHVLALGLWLSGQHLNRPCNLGEASRGHKASRSEQASRTPRRPGTHYEMYEFATATVRLRSAQDTAAPARGMPH